MTENVRDSYDAMAERYAELFLAGQVAQVRSRGNQLWGYVELNHGPHPYQGCALTN